MFQKFFNIAGPCVPQEHYMLPASERLSDIQSLIEQRLYFVIHAARQSGKTTLLKDLTRTLNATGAYYALYCSLESVQEIADPEKGMPALVDQVRSAVKYSPVLAARPFGKTVDRSNYSTMLKESVTDFCAGLDKPLIVLFDEADCLSNGTLISFLRQLREGYINRSDTPFIHSLALVGMRNIRDYAGKIRDDRQTLGSASPFNIVTESLTLRDFTLAEVRQLYRQHTEATAQVFSDEGIAQAYHYSQGQPWLVNALAREVVVKLLNNDFSQPITVEHFDQAAQNIILRRDTHIDSLHERLKEERVRRIVEPMILGKTEGIDYQSDDCQYVLDLGLLTQKDKSLVPSNPMYSEVIIRTLTHNGQRDFEQTIDNPWIVEGRLDMGALLKAFQQFWRENSEIWIERYQYKEAAPHLILMAFLQRVINGGGQILREFASGRGRLDLCVHYAKKKYPIELKIYSGKKTRDDGLLQLSAYMDTLDATEGWLLIFDRHPERTWDEKITWETIRPNGKTIHVLGV